MDVTINGLGFIHYTLQHLLLLLKHVFRCWKMEAGGSGLHPQPAKEETMGDRLLMPMTTRSAFFRFDIGMHVWTRMPGCSDTC